MTNDLVVTEENFEHALAELARVPDRAVDTETTGLRAYAGHRMFSLIIAVPHLVAYFNYKPYPEHPGLPRWTLQRLKEVLFDDPAALWYLANAKFDMHMLAADGVELQGQVHDVLCYERLIYNKHPNYDLASIAKCYGFEKSKVVDEHIAKHRLYTKRRVAGKKKEVVDKHFDRVPFPIIAPYGLKDGRITYDVAVRQRARLYDIYGSISRGALVDQGVELVKNERALTKVCFEMERGGMRIDRAYCEEAFAFTNARAMAAAAEFRRLTGADLVDSAAALKPLLERAGVAAGRTEPSKRFPDGQPSYAKRALAVAKHPVADAILDFRRFSKVAGTYFRNYLDLADANDRIHGDLRQGGTDTGRFSMSDPNLQNLKRNEEDDDALAGEEALDAETSFNVRRAFIPPPDFCYVMIDYDQQEYRLMLDLAGQLDLIEKILGGLDVHTATAAMMGVPRGRAKTLNFLIIYGGGDGALATSWGVSLEEAQEARYKYFQVLPDVQRFIRSTINQAKNTGLVQNWAGRLYHFAREDAYKAPNTVIQGGGGDIMRRAMVQLAQGVLKGRRSRMALTVHDELLFEIHESELGLVPELKHVMETVYPHRYLPLTCSVSHSWDSWADKVKGEPLAACL